MGPRNGLAFERLEGRGPGVIFLGGLRSDMTGTKAQALRDHCAAQGRAFLRFDYRGHGASPGRFQDHVTSDWLADARAMLDASDGPQVLVGSSMGGWVALLLAREVPQKVAALLTIAAAPDFTEDGFWAGFDAVQRAALARDGRVSLPSAYGEPLVLTRRLIEDGRAILVLRTPLALPMPVRMLQGTADDVVLPDRALRLLDHATGPDIRLTLVKGADHRFSDPACLALLAATLDEIRA